MMNQYYYEDGTTSAVRDFKKVLHRIGAPAVILKDGQQFWYVHGKLHRDDGPAETRKNGFEAWYNNGELHREAGPAITFADGATAWYLNGVPHRTDGAAIEHVDGDRQWYINGVLHRTDGPAHENPRGNTWFVKGERFMILPKEVLEAYANRVYGYYDLKTLWSRDKDPVVRNSARALYQLQSQ